MTETEAQRKQQNADALKNVRAIARMKDAAGRLGYEIAEVDFFDEGFGGDSYDTIGSDLLSLIERNHDQAALVEEVVIAICGYGFESLRNRMKEHLEYWQAL